MLNLQVGGEIRETIRNGVEAMGAATFVEHTLVLVSFEGN